MKLSKFVPVLVLVLLFFLFFGKPFSAEINLTADWGKVSEATAANLPKSAVAALDDIIAKTFPDTDEKLAGDALKAILLKAAFSAAIDGGRASGGTGAVFIRTLTPYLEKASPALRPMLEAALANAWNNYYRENRWRLLRRTATTEAGDDFLTCDARRVLAETGKHFDAALAAADLLKKTPVSVFDSVLKKGTLSDAYRPTLFDFVANDAIAFYALGEQGLPAAENAFVLTSDSPALGTAEAFLQWRAAGSVAGSAGVSSASDSPILKTISLFREILRFHQNDTDRRAFNDADLNRLAWAKKTLGDTAGAGEKYTAALRAFIKTNDTCETTVEATARLAELLSRIDNDEGDVEAKEKNAARVHGMLTQAAAKFPDSPGAKHCLRLIAGLERRELGNIVTERVWVPATATPTEISITAKNLDAITFRAVPANWHDFLARKSPRPDDLGKKEVRKLLERPGAKTWTVQLPKRKYVSQTHAVPAPDDLAPGFYILVASVRPNFSEEDNALRCASFWVSKLALVTGKEAALGKLEPNNEHGFVLDAATGEPVAGAEIVGWQLNKNGDREKTGPVQTDAAGAFSLPAKSQSNASRNVLVIAKTASGQTIANEQTYYYHGYESDETDARKTRQYVHFLTDRAIYRPGQMIQFKGVVYSANPDTNEYEILADKKVIVAIDDPNDKEVARLECVTNGFGSISGSFTIPAGRLTGGYKIHTVGPENGHGYVSVEEYKRPKFDVEMKPPAIAPKLGETVVVAGTALAYTGAPIDSAQVKWSVRREVRWPHWCWRMSSHGGGSQEIAHGTATTDAGGKFQIEFPATPDKSADPENEPIFNYTVTAEVTDSAGETRDARQTVNVGYTALQARIYADDWITSDKIFNLKINTTTLDGVPQSAAGEVKFYALKQPEKVYGKPLEKDFSRHASNENPGDSRIWPEGDVAGKFDFSSDAKKGEAVVTPKLPAGIYRAILTSKDRFGKTVTARVDFRVNDLAADKYGIREPFSFSTSKNEYVPGETFTALWGTGYDSGRALVSLENRGKILKRFWTDSGRTQQVITLPVTEELRGGFTVKIMQVRDNRLYAKSRLIAVPWNNKTLKISWEKFNSKLVPGGKEIWTAKVARTDESVSSDSGNAADSQMPDSVELCAALYDASLEQFRENAWSGLKGFYREYYTSWSYNLRFANEPVSLRYLSSIPENPKSDYFRYDHRRWMISADGVSLPEYERGPENRGVLFGVAPPNSKNPAAVFSESREADTITAAGELADDSLSPASSPDLSAVSARKNLQETAFFFPTLLAEKDGTFRMEFTVPEALTRWKFLAFAHDRQLRSGVMTDFAVTTKDLMIQPNAPRFVREGDTIEFSVKITNKTDAPATGKIRLEFKDALSLDSVDTALNNQTPERKFSLPANSSQSLAWRITVPDGQGFLVYKAVGVSATASDGEEGFLPVLSRRQLVTESLPLPIRGPQTKTFNFEKLLASGGDTTLRNESLKVQMVSQPVWYAVLALPYLAEYPHECSEQLFSRVYANALAAHIAESDPKIARVFETWKNMPALDSPLFKNEDMKSVLIEETPWLRDAAGESEQRRNIAILFDKNRTDAEIKNGLRKLAERQDADGYWSWFPGGPMNDYITRNIVAGFGRLKHSGVAIDIAPALRALPATDTWLTKIFENIKKSAAKRGTDYREENNLSSMVAYQLYARSFFLKDAPIAPANKAAYDYFREQAAKFWTTQCRQSQGHLALALRRFDAADKTPAAVVASLKERAIVNEETGMHWAEKSGWFWYEAPVETHVLMIELFDEVAGDKAAVDDCQTWLLKQKQANAWRSTKSTSDAVYALLLRGANKLGSDALVSVSLGGKTIRPTNVEPGTGFYEERIAGANVVPADGKIVVRKTDDGVAWGNVTWQYFQDVDKITPHAGTPLTLKKSLWKKTQTERGAVLLPVSKTQLQVGDTLVVRVELRCDRDVEFVHLKDQRGSGTEPVNVLSGYRRQDGLGYYESTRDTASHFFIDRLRAGTYVFEYPVRVQLKGEYQSGIAEVQCMYAPEFNAHSASEKIVVK